MALEAGEMAVTIEYAKDLKDKDIFGKQDPYCIVKIGSQQYRTRTATDGGKSPVWNETFRFNVINENDVELVVKDDDVGRDDYIGVTRVNCAKARLQGRDTIQAPVVSKSGKQHGYVQLTLTFTRRIVTPGAYQAAYQPQQYAQYAYPQQVPGYGAPQPGYAAAYAQPAYGAPPGYGAAPPAYGAPAAGAYAPPAAAPYPPPGGAGYPAAQPQGGYAQQHAGYAQQQVYPPPQAYQQQPGYPAPGQYAAPTQQAQYAAPTQQQQQAPYGAPQQYGAPPAYGAYPTYK